MEKLRMFYYHAVIRFQKREWWSNLDHDELLHSLVIPYVSSQVRLVNRPYGKVVLNFGIANFLSVFRTDYKLPEPEGFEKAWGEWSESEFRKNDYTEQIVEEALKIKWAAKTKSPLELPFIQPKRQVFIIMKFGDKVLDSAYEGVIKPTVKKFKYSPLRIDEIHDGGRITDQMIEEIARSEIVMADLTGERPNCYYEAGFAHAIGKEMIFTIKRGATIHFDLATYRFIEWETENELRRELSKRFNVIKQRATQT